MHGRPVGRTHERVSPYTFGHRRSARRRQQILVSCLALALGITSCENHQADPTAPPAQTSITLTPRSLGLGIQRGHLKLRTQGHLTDEYLADEVRRAIDPDDFACSSTPLRTWLARQLDIWRSEEPETFDLLHLQLQCIAEFQCPISGVLRTRRMARL
jgi:hypothetical protein